MHNMRKLTQYLQDLWGCKYCRYHAIALGVGVTLLLMGWAIPAVIAWYIAGIFAGYKLMLDDTVTNITLTKESNWFYPNSSTFPNGSSERAADILEEYQTYAREIVRDKERKPRV